MKTTKAFLVAIAILIGIFSGSPVSAQVTVTGAVGGNGTYAKLQLAFSAINGTTQTGANIVVQITASTSESSTATLNAGTWTTLKIYPTVAGRTITGNLAAPLINLNGADNVTIDGRLNGTGSTPDLILINTNTGGSTIQFIADACTNTVQFCNIRGSRTSLTSGTILFSTGTTTGNDGNTIDRCNIYDGASTPYVGIYSAGTTTASTYYNSGNTISNNNIYNFSNLTGEDCGILVSSGNTDWTITGNSLYQTATRTSTTAATDYGICIDGGSYLGNNFTVTGNFIGGSASGCTGTAWTEAGAGVANVSDLISLKVGTTTASNIKGNTIANFTWNALDGWWTGIHVGSGNVNIGGSETGEGNTIGSLTGSTSIRVIPASGSPSRISNGIINTSSGVISISYNTISSITVGSTSVQHDFNAIRNEGGTLLTIDHNTIGSTDGLSSITTAACTSTTSCVLIGITNNASATLAITNNTIANLYNASVPTSAYTSGILKGISTTSGVNTIIGNNLFSLSTAANATGTGANTSVVGIRMTSTTAGTTIQQNTIYGLSNTHASAATAVTGIYDAGATTGTNVVARNSVYGLNISSSSTSAEMRGIDFTSGLATVQNNIIRLGYDASGSAITSGISMTGLYDGGCTANSGIYFNSVYIGGTGVNTTAGVTYAFRSTTITNTRTFENNIFVNARSNASTGGKHYAVMVAGTAANPAGLTLNYNDYVASGTGGVFGYFNSADVANLSNWQTVTGQDTYSVSADPQFIAPTAATPDLHIIPTGVTPIEGAGVAIGSVTDDYDGETRSALTPTDMGADTGNFLAPVEVWKSGVKQARYSALQAAFTAINAGTHIGALDVKINANITETTTAVLNASGGTASYTSVKVYPTVTGLTITGDLAAPLIDLNGADNVTIDGSLNGTGSTADLTIINTNTGGSTIQFIADACTNTIKYCNIQGISTSTTRGTILFSTGTTTGNDGNTIDHCNIYDGATTPYNAIYSAGTTTNASYYNSGNTISSNNIYNFCNLTGIDAGIYLSSGNTDWTISGNSFYQTATRTSTTAATDYGICIDGGSYLGDNFTVTGNFIGGSAAGCTGTAWTVTGGVANQFVGINSVSTGTVNISNNTLSGMTIISSTATIGSTLYGIQTAGTAGNYTISGNTIGNASVADSFRAGTSGTTTGATSVIGIKNAATGIISISGNIIANLVSYGVNTASIIRGISSSAGANTITSNTVRDLSTPCSNTASGATASVIGISLTSTTIGTTLSQNTIFGLSNTHTSAAVGVTGIYYAGATSGANVIARNLIYGLSISSSSATAEMRGINFALGLATVQNNMIRLGYNTAGAALTTGYVIIGLYDVSSTAGTGIYFNSVYIGGTGVNTTAGSTYAFRSTTITSVRTFENNIFVNARSNATSGGKHYAVMVAGTAANPAGLTLNYNDYLVSGTGGVFGYFNSADRTSLADWQTATGQDANSVSSDPQFIAPTAATPNLHISTTSVTSIEGAGVVVASVTDDIDGETRSVLTPTDIGADAGNFLASVEVWESGAKQANYASLNAAFAAINVGTHTGILDVKITGNITEPTTAVLNASNGSAPNYTSVKVYPTVTGLTITGNLAAPLINLNGANYVTFDGSLDGTGSSPDLTIINTSTSTTTGTSTIRFIGDASNNTVQYCNIRGSGNTTSSGTIFFSTGTASGNSDNKITNCNIYDGAALPFIGIYSLGSSSAVSNNRNTISDNNIYNYFTFINSYADAGVYIDSFNSDWTISGNNFYQTASRTSTWHCSHYGIYINCPTGNNFDISDNNIGGGSAGCGAPTWTENNTTLNNKFYGIYLGVGTTTASNVKRNTIANFKWNTGPGFWTGIEIPSGNVNIGGVGAGNLIGNPVGSTSIQILPTTASVTFVSYGINTYSSGIVNVLYNTISSITLSATTYHYFSFINTMGTGTYTIDHNTIGSSTEPNSITTSASTATPMRLIGISNAGSGARVITNNIIANITNASSPSSAYSSASILTGISSSSETNTITGNFICNLSTPANHTGTDTKASVMGINAVSTTAGTTIEQNTIYGLSNTHSTAATTVVGLYYTGATTGTNQISKNMVYGLTKSSASGKIFGLFFDEGLLTASNNIVSLGIGSTTGNTIYGIWDGVTTAKTNLYFNDVYLAGAMTSGTNRSYCLYSLSSSYAHDYRNNLFVNARSTTGSSNLHFALYLAYGTTTNLTLSNNDYYVSGTGGAIGYFNATPYATLALFKGATGKDANSLSVNPGFTTNPPLAVADYTPTNNSLAGVAGTGITTDFLGATRSTSLPAMGAIEIATVLPTLLIQIP